MIILHHSAIFATNEIPTHSIINISVAIIVDIVERNLSFIVPNHILQIGMSDVYTPIYHRYYDGL